MNSIDLSEPTHHTVIEIKDRQDRKLYANTVTDYWLRLNTLDKLKPEMSDDFRVAKYVIGKKQPSPIGGTVIFGQLRKNDKGIVLAWKEFVE